MSCSSFKRFARINSLLFPTRLDRYCVRNPSSPLLILLLQNNAEMYRDQIKRQRVNNFHIMADDLLICTMEDTSREGVGGTGYAHHIPKSLTFQQP